MEELPDLQSLLDLHLPLGLQPQLILQPLLDLLPGLPCVATLLSYTHVRASGFNSSTHLLPVHTHGAALQVRTSPQAIREYFGGPNGFLSKKPKGRIDERVIQELGPDLAVDSGSYTFQTVVSGTPEAATFACLHLPRCEVGKKQRMCLTLKMRTIECASCSLGHAALSEQAGNICTLHVMYC